MMIPLSFTLLAVFATTTALAKDALQITAIVGKDMKSTVECWTLAQEFQNARGMRIQLLGDLSKATYTEMPTDKDFKQGFYTAPNLQYFVILEGNATITFPTSDEILHVKPNQIYAATDNAATSELVTSPSSAPARASSSSRSRTELYQSTLPPTGNVVPLMPLETNCDIP
ncbi:hypothetical protein BV20DRAFT_180173 [Pilatotrama ljubarskyi]|nr:hypothetical protein BV20DRAFT_180173 [Pilatotrama ljubarskyi]